MRLLKTICVNILLMFAAQYLHAQETKTRLPELDVLIGSWNVAAENRLSENGPGERNKGTAVIKRAAGEACIEEEYTGALNNKSFFTKSIIAYNRFTNVFQCVFIDSEHGVLLDYEGTKNADTIFFDKTWTYPNGSKVKLRVVYIIISPDEFTIENMRMPENVSEWDVTGKMHFTKRR